MKAAENIDTLAASWVVRRDTGLTGAEQGEFESWLNSDPEHGRAVARFTVAWATLGRPAQNGIAGRLLREIASRRRRRARRRWALACTGMGIAVILVLAWRPTNHFALEDRPASTVTEAPPSRQVLADGSVVELRDGAEIAVDFGSRLRLVTLRRGEAHFQVTKNPARPFVVQAGRIQVRAVGTAFEVQLEPDKVDVLVTEGRVSVDQASPGKGRPNSPPESLALVGAGKGVVIAEDSLTGRAVQVRPIGAAEINERLAWRSSRVEFSNTPLSEAIALLNKHNRVRFVIMDPALESIRVSGFIRADNAEAFAQILESGFNIKVSRRGANEIVLERAQFPAAK